jgi:hypothetical protein
VQEEVEGRIFCKMSFSRVLPVFGEELCRVPVLLPEKLEYQLYVARRARAPALLPEKLEYQLYVARRATVECQLCCKKS